MLQRTYVHVLSVIPAITQEWLETTTGSVPDEVPVFGWPLDNKLEAVFRGAIPAEDHELIKDTVFRHFDGLRDQPIFPIASVEVHVSSYDTTHITVNGDISRAGSMQQLRELA